MKPELKKALLNMAEGHAMQAVEDVYGLAQVYVDSTESPLDNTLLEGLKLLKASIKEAIDKIDGEDDIQ